jgi:fructose-1,6-bisphosphatase/inositol monophosphatase family enzyme
VVRENGVVGGAGLEAGVGGSNKRTRQRRNAAAGAGLDAVGLEAVAAAAAAGGVSGRLGMDPWSFVAAAVLLQEVGRAVLEGHEV